MLSLLNQINNKKTTCFQSKAGHRRQGDLGTSSRCCLKEIKIISEMLVRGQARKESTCKGWSAMSHMLCLCNWQQIVITCSDIHEKILLPRSVLSLFDFLRQDLTMSLRLALNPLSSYLSLPSAGITGVIQCEPLKPAFRFD
jgi:hypothetical protein